MPELTDYWRNAVIGDLREGHRLGICFSSCHLSETPQRLRGLIDHRLKLGVCCGPQRQESFVVSAGVGGFPFAFRHAAQPDAPGAISRRSRLPPVV